MVNKNFFLIYIKNKLDLVVKIDCRERELISELQDLKFIKVEQLELGDLIIETEQNIIVIERKTSSDLVGSIIDGRFREQKRRLLMFKEQCKKNCFVAFLIENNNYPVQFKRHLHSSLIHLNFLYDFKILYSRSIVDSAEIVKHLIQEKFINETVQTKTSDDETPCIKQFKKNCGYSNFVKLIASIDGISLNTSLAIEQSGINNISILIDTIKNSPERLETITVGKRRITKTIVNKIKIGLDL